MNGFQFFQNPKTAWKKCSWPIMGSIFGLKHLPKSPKKWPAKSQDTSGPTGCGRTSIPVCCYFELNRAVIIPNNKLWECFWYPLSAESTVFLHHVGVQSGSYLPLPQHQSWTLTLRERLAFFPACPWIILVLHHYTHFRKKTKKVLQCVGSRILDFNDKKAISSQFWGPVCIEILVNFIEVWGFLSFSFLSFFSKLHIENDTTSWAPPDMRYCDVVVSIPDLDNVTVTPGKWVGLDFR